MDRTGIEWLNNLPPWDGNNFTPLDVASNILEQLGNPQNQYQTIHIAGTNGKGTVASLLNHIFLKSGLFDKVGLMSSPHLNVINERCLINLLSIDDASLSEALLEVRRICISLQATPTYFVAVTAAIFKIFADKKVSIAIIEVGLGGRKDATNLISKPKLSVITSIGFDHQEQLGDSIAKIALNKAGIIKENVDLVIGNLSKEAREVILLEAKEKNSNILERIENINLDEQYFLPKYLQENLKIALRCAKVYGIEPKHAISLLTGYSWPRRFNIWEHAINKTEVIVDGAHNIDGVSALLQAVKSYQKREPKFKRIKLLFSFLKRKNWKLSFSPILNFCDQGIFERIELVPICLASDFVSSVEYQESFSKLNFSPPVTTNEQFEIQLEPFNNAENLSICFGTLQLPTSLESILKLYSYNFKPLF